MQFTVACNLQILLSIENNTRAFHVWSRSASSLSSPLLLPYPLVSRAQFALLASATTLSSGTPCPVRSPRLFYYPTLWYPAHDSGIPDLYIYVHHTRVGVKYSTCTWYLYLRTYLSVLDVLEYLVYGNAKVLVLVLDQKVLVLVLDQKVLGTYK